MTGPKKGKPVKGGKAGAAAKRPAKRAAAKQPSAPQAKGKAPAAPRDLVVVGIIDDAICFASDRFRIGDKTRVEFFWIQDGIRPAPGAPVFSGSPPVTYGLELAKHDQLPYKGIDTMLAECTHAGAVDEDEVYRRTGLVDFLHAGQQAAAKRIAHGTHVMDLAAGEDADSKCENRPIVCVQLPATVTADTSGRDLHTYALDAIEYIFLRAKEIGDRHGIAAVPVVINFSYGMVGGPHDGTSELEMAVDALVEWRRTVKNAPTAVVLPSGNSYLSRCHTKIEFDAPGDEVELPWRIPPDDWTSSYVEIWMPYCDPASGTGDRVEVTVETPGGAVFTPGLGEDPNTVFEWLSGTGSVCSVRYIYVPANTDRGMFLVRVAPTFSLDPAVTTAPAGTWNVRIKNVAMPQGAPIQVWVLRDDTLFGHPRRGRQSFFDAPCYRRFDHMGRPEQNDQPGCPVERASLQNAIGTGDKPAVIGAFLRKEMAPADYSAGGPITPPRGAAQAHRAGPDAMAVGDDSIVLHGVLAAGSRSGSVVAMNGTSVAAPQITRMVAALMGNGKPGDRWAVQNVADDQENGPPKRPNRPTPERGGAGRILLPPRTRVPR